ncbi:MAG: PCMD domain-containing protein [Muribaculaceae bacterium]|nr:PCMD domain-containing protein [Muribaculaceae bacterium]
MKILNKIISASAVALTFLSLQGCVSETPFEAGKEGTLRLSAQLRGDITSVVTRAADYDQHTLEDNLVVYIQKENVGVIRKFKGIEEVQSANVSLQTGSYVVEGWTGDSVSASFDKKFYYGYKPIEVKEGSNSISLQCDIANVLASVNTELVSDMISDLTVEIGHTRGSLTFDSDMIAADRRGDTKGYFMMPNGVKDLYYKISGKNSDGTPFLKEGEIEGVERAHDYQFVLKADAAQVTQGGALIKIEIVEVPVIDEEVTVFPAPAFKLTMGGEQVKNPAKQLNLTKGGYGDLALRIVAYKGLPHLKVSFSDNFNFGVDSEFELGSDNVSSLPQVFGFEKKLVEDNVADAVNEKVDVVECWFTVPDSYIKSLPVSEQEFSITFDVEDGKGCTNQLKLHWANSESAIEQIDPVGAVSTDDFNDESAVGARYVTLYGEIYDEEVTDYGIMLREDGTENWSYYPATRAGGSKNRFSVVVKDLKPATVYQYKTYADDFEEDLVKTFTTESIFSIPGASFEEWSSYKASTLLGTKDVILPGSTGDKTTSFWGSGNEGAATANLTLTNKSTDMKHSGSYSARLGSNAALGVIAAGNIFTGYYVKTDGTNGVLSVGREYNGSHPSALKVYANYRPGGGVSVKSGNEKFIEDMVEGGTDQGQIYVALTTEPYEIRTNPDNRRLFEKNDPSVVAYGQITWKEAFGPDGELQEIVIPLDYNKKVKTLKPTHLVIVCSASKFGDYFCGSKTSVMYLDDFELLYEEPSGILTE